MVQGLPFILSHPKEGAFLFKKLQTVYMSNGKVGSEGRVTLGLGGGSLALKVG